MLISAQRASLAFSIACVAVVLQGYTNCYQRRGWCTVKCRDSGSGGSRGGRGTRRMIQQRVIIEQDSQVHRARQVQAAATCGSTLADKHYAVKAFHSDIAVIDTPVEHCLIRSSAV